MTRLADRPFPTFDHGSGGSVIAFDHEPIKFVRRGRWSCTADDLHRSVAGSENSRSDLAEKNFDNVDHTVPVMRRHA